MEKTMLEDFKLDIPCPACGQKTAKTIGWVKANDHLACAHCGRDFTLDRDQFLGEITKAEKSLAKFRRSFGKL